jgi:lysophospholipase L1-like esterase
MSGILGTEATAGWTRRRFILGASGASAAGLAVASLAPGQTVPPAIVDSDRPSLIRRGQTILFQGDSITDAGRNRNLEEERNLHQALGGGYAWLAASELLVDRPEDGLRIYNRGISGDKVYQLADRWDADCLALKPDVLSILIGVNDFWAIAKHGYDGTLDKYVRDYRELINRTKVTLPDVRLVICEPFVLKVGAVDDSWFPAFNGYRAAAKKLADDSKATFVPFQSMFDAAVKVAPPETWAADGVHPTIDGAALMAHCWLKAVGA